VALVGLLEAAKTDSIPKNRRHAIHALTCDVCKPNRQALAIDIRSELKHIAETAEDLSVKLLALQELAEVAESSETQA
jgi:hypothetical protein